MKEKGLIIENLTFEKGMGNLFSLDNFLVSYLDEHQDQRCIFFYGIYFSIAS